MEQKIISFDTEHLVAIAKDALNRGAYMEAFLILNGITVLFPNFTQSYNFLAWLYETVFSDFESADYNYCKSIALDPGYLPAYLNYASFLNLMERYDDLKTLLDQASQFQGIDKVYLNKEYGKMYEKQEAFEEAIGAYKEAIRLSLQLPEVEEMKSAIERCRIKQEISL